MAMPREKQCLICNGLGRKRCINCSGTGYVIKGHYTYDADGRSVYREVHEPHVECGGTGQAMCYNCGGTGRVSSGVIDQPVRRSAAGMTYQQAWKDFTKRVDRCDLLSQAEKKSYYDAMLDVISPHNDVIERLANLRRRWEPQWEAMGLEGTLIEAYFFTLEHAARAHYPDDE